MEKIFDVDKQDGDDAGQGLMGAAMGAGGGGAAGGSQGHQRGEEEKGYKFWVDVDIFKV